MAVYQGKIAKNLLVDRIVGHLTGVPSGATEPFWKKVQSGSYANEGYILESKGKEGNKKLFVRFSGAPTIGAITMSMMENYVPNASAGLTGTVTNESVKENVTYHNGSYADTYPVHYFLSFDRDKIMLLLKADPTIVTGHAQVFCWIGLPRRMDIADDNTAMIFGVSKFGYELIDYPSNASGSLGMLRVLRNRKRDAQARSYLRTLSKFKTKGWGGHLLLPHMYVEDVNNWEGVRSVVEGAHPVFQDATATDFKDGDEVVVGTKRYTIFNVYNVPNASNSINCFPSPWMAVEQIL